MTAARQKPRRGSVKQCKPGGPYCVGMEALLDADVKRGVQAGTMMSLGSARVTREVIVHTALVEGKKRPLVFTFCPACGGRLVAEEKPAPQERRTS